MAVQERLRFLHLADIHLGYRQYNLESREEDFFLAFRDVITRYALPQKEGGKPQVDFVVIAGDLFDTRQIQPVTLDRASQVLDSLQEAGIKVFAMEGNHDARRRRDEPCWYDYLCNAGKMIFLRDEVEEHQISFMPWDEETRTGSYYDITPDVRIFGTHWYGATAGRKISAIKDALRRLPRKKVQIMMFHGGLSTYVNALSGGVEEEVIAQLRPHIDYLALGHIHKEYNLDGWIFNPGGIEVSKSREYEEPHGVYLVEVRLPKGEIFAIHEMAYRKRPFVTLVFDGSEYKTPEDYLEALHKQLDEEGRAAIERLRSTWPPAIPFPKPILHVYLTGSLGFPFSSLQLAEQELRICGMLRLESVRYENKTQAILPDSSEDYPTLSDGQLDRAKLEEQIFQSLIEADTRYEKEAPLLAPFTCHLKARLLEEHAIQKAEERKAMTEQLLTLLLPSSTEETTEESKEA